MSPPRRGDVYWVNLDPVVGTEIRKTRPVVIVSNDACNRYGPRVVVVPLTSNLAAVYPTDTIVEINGRASRAQGDQIRSVDKARLQRRLGRLTADDLARLSEALAVTLALPL